MDYKTMRDRIEDMAKDNHKDFVKAVISMEKGINDESALDKLYEAYMDNDSLNLLHEEFDYMIEDLREQGQIKDLPYVQEEKDNLVNIVGNFVKLFGQLRTSIDDNGKEHSNVRIFSSKLLKAKEQMKEQDKSQEIAKLKSEIEEREKDLFFADSWEQLGQIRADIEEMKAKLNTLTGSEKGKENDKKSILGAIKEYQAEDKENNVDDKGNFYDPLSKDTDNDGIPDRYDNAFQDSDYFESTYDVEDNLHAKEEQEKPSISAQIQKYQQEEKANERRQCISEERNDELSR